MRIITELPPSNTALRDRLIREIKTGFQFMKERERAEELEAAQQAQDLRNQKEIKGLGRCVAVIPRDQYFLAQKRYGHEEVQSTEFIRFFQKKHPELTPHKL